MLSAEMRNYKRSILREKVRRHAFNQEKSEIQENTTNKNGKKARSPPRSRPRNVRLKKKGKKHDQDK